MKTKYKYIEFVKENEASIFWLCNNIKDKSNLCIIEYYGVWRQWIMCDVTQGTVFNSTCLLDIANFLKQLNDGGK